MKLRMLSQLFSQELSELRRAEEQIITALETVFQAAVSPELQDALVIHLQETKGHLSRLKLLSADYPQADSAPECEVLAGLIAEADEIIDGEADDILRDLGLIAVCQRIEHYELAAYGCARTYAKRLGDDNAVELLSLTIEEEGAADTILTEIAEDLLEEVEDGVPAAA